MTSRPEPIDSVRLALPAEAAAIAALQRRSWSAAPGPQVTAVLDEVSLEEMTTAWHRAVTRPPLARCRVLVALSAAGGAPVGFAATVPSDDADAGPADGAVDEFAVEPAARHRGHGSRLLHACVDTLRADGFTRARWWLNADDDEVRGFLLAAGWAADGAWREIGSPDGRLRLKQVRMHTDIADQGP